MDIYDPISAVWNEKLGRKLRREMGAASSCREKGAEPIRDKRLEVRSKNELLDIYDPISAVWNEKLGRKLRREMGAASSCREMGAATRRRIMMR